MKKVTGEINETVNMRDPIESSFKGKGRVTVYIRTSQKAGKCWGKRVENIPLYQLSLCISYRSFFKSDDKESELKIFVLIMKSAACKMNLW